MTSKRIGSAPCRRSLSTLGKLNPAALAGFFCGTPFEWMMAMRPRRSFGRTGMPGSGHPDWSSLSPAQAERPHRLPRLAAVSSVRNATSRRNRARGMKSPREMPRARGHPPRGLNLGFNLEAVARVGVGIMASLRVSIRRPTLNQIRKRAPPKRLSRSPLRLGGESQKRQTRCCVGSPTHHAAWLNALPAAFCAPAAVAVQAIPVAAAAFFATRLSFEPVFRSALFAVFLTFDKDPDLLRFFMCSSVCP